MLKRFLFSFLGSMIAIWVSIIIAVLGLVGFIGSAIAASSEKSSSAVSSRSILHIDLSGPITERNSMPELREVLTGNDQSSTGLDDINAAILAAASDVNIDGIYITAPGASAGIATRYSILKTLHRFKEIAPEKWIYAYSDSYSQGDYLIASAADSIFLNPIGQIDFHGLSATGLYFRQLLANLGIQIQVVKVGTYKSAVEPFLLDSISAPAREQQMLYLSNIWDQLKDAIAEGRGVEAETVNSWASSFIFAEDPQYYVNHKIADRLVYEHEMMDILADATDAKKPELVGVTDYIKAPNVKGLDKVYSINPGSKSRATIAILYAEGDITVDGKGGIASSRLVPEIEKLTESDDFDGLILRVNSGGGSAFASEQIWEALERFKEKTDKPFYVSMGDVAASGGYYISCGADKIYAQPVTLTGSIGIFGILPNASKLLNDKIGVHTSTVSTNPASDMLVPYKPLTKPQYDAMQRYVDRGYELFVSRCAAGRHTTTDSIKAIAEGRVWDGVEAHRINLVDELGGLDMAIADMARQLDAEAITIESYPKLEPDVWAMILSASSDLSNSVMREQLGFFYPHFRAFTDAIDTDPLQCRMQAFEIK
ncbi:MAG: signal peptide peptidase SppA [Duncaniella sp.]|nr:signal peptide peptidase SppA [Duncaniella sp.]